MSYDENALRARVDAARRQIRTLLDTTRHPQYAADVPHRYDDKYLLAEVATRVAIAAALQALEVVGLTPEQLAKLQDWAKTRTVTLRLVAQEDCRFVREASRKVESADERVVETRGLLGKSTRTEKVVTTVVEYFWAFDFDYKLVAFQGTDVDHAIPVHARKGATEIMTTTDATPRPKTVVRDPRDLDLTWLVTHTDAEGRPAFAIDRAHADCHTPRRNADIEAALAAFTDLAAWCGTVGAYFTGTLFPAQQDHGRDLAAIDDAAIFVPVLPLFESEQLEGEGPAPLAYANAFLAEQQRTLAEKCRALSTVFPRDTSVITAVEAALLVTLKHLARVSRQHADVVDYIEGMLRAQLVAAIGKELTPADFTAYMAFHAKKLLRPGYQPVPFSYAVRRPEHDPEGVLAIEAGAGSTAEAIATSVRRSDAPRPMSFALDASTRVRFGGDRYVHAWVSHQFSGAPAPALSLVARARQFSSFIVLVGRIASAEAFEPTLGIIVHNKDLLKIPLMLEQIPTPKEFRDAIESLSPEQQRFAKAFRGMQLESTLFGVCIIQIKPQLEKLLRLPPDSLTKEIRLTQELLDLFIQYQIPSDLLSYDGEADAPSADKLERVRSYVARMHEMIELSKQKELAEEREREAMRVAEMNRTMMLQQPQAPAGLPFGGPPSMPSAAPGGAVMRSPSPQKTMMSMSGPPPVQSAAPPPMMMAPPIAAPPPMPPAPAPVTVAATPVAATPVAQTVAASADAMDYTRLPGELDKKFEALDADGALRATILKPGDPWSRTAQKGLLGGPVSSTLYASDQRTERNRAFDLLDALSKSGALAIDDASLHVVLAATHCFDKTLVDTVIQDNVNPIEKVERSLLIVGTTIHGLPASELLAVDQRERFFATSPQLAGGDRDPQT